MRRIGILTFHRSSNNGAFIQCYSLLNKLQQDLPDDKIEVVDYAMPRVHAKIYADNLLEYFSYSDIKTFTSKCKQLIKDPLKLKRQRIKNNIFNNSLNKLSLSDTYIYDDKTDVLFKYICDNYDCVVVGSDAVWNYSLRGFPNPYFLSKNLNVKKYTYAASCYGMNYENISLNEKKTIGYILNSYEYIGVRDDESYHFAKDIGYKNEIYHNCDPTILLDVNSLPIDGALFLEKIINKGFDPKRKTVGVMGSNEMCMMAKRVFGKDYQIVSLFNYCKEADVNLFDINPFEWAFVFRYFTITITTYFHGTLLSLKNGVPVLCIDLPNSYSAVHTSKVKDFLTRIGLEDYYLYTDYSYKDDEYIFSKAKCAIDNLSYNKIINILDKESVFYNSFYNSIR